MLSTIAIVPSAPVMVPELAGAAAAELLDLRDAVRAAAESLPSRWIAVGVAARDAVIAPDSAGTFAGYGVDVQVALSPNHCRPVADMTLCALIAGWMRGTFAPQARVEVRACAAGHDPDSALEIGRQLGAEVAETADQIGVVVIADGANTLTQRAPGGYDPDSIALQQRLDDALAAGDAAALTSLSDTIGGRVAFQVLAGLTQPAAKSARELYRGAPYGVGYFVGCWRL
ncbi:hypothetical protein [Micromonospora sp. WMMD736]|uniref:hypothetical protein n=1 Tax=Micromonospora sp. WMMD736 TaxID=3404112 RepID=UPI003B958501